MKCAGGCGGEPVGVAAIAIYPFRALMRYYRTDQPMTRVVLDLPLCRACFDKRKLKDIFPDQMLREIARPIERSSGIVADIAGTRMSLLSFHSEEYRLLRQRRSKESS